MHHFVYKITNTINGKIYIGKHSTDNLNDGYMGSGTLIVQAIKKYGHDAFVKVILEEHDSSEQSLEAEIRLIAEHKSKECGIGYNLTDGGEGRLGFHFRHTDAAKEKIRKSNTGHVVSVETRQKIVDALTGQARGPLSEEHKQKLSAIHTGRIISDETRSKISESLMGRSVDEETKAKISDTLKKRGFEPGDRALAVKKSWETRKLQCQTSKPVEQYSYDGSTLIATHKNIRAACMSINKDVSKYNGSIGLCCDGLQKHAYGFSWRWAT